METKTVYEEEILKEIRNLSEPLQGKLFKIIHLLNQEIIRPEYDEKLATKDFLSICGTWEDDRTAEEQIKDIYSSRKSTEHFSRIDNLPMQNWLDKNNSDKI